MEGQERCEERGGAREVKGGEEGRGKGGERVEGERRDKGGGCREWITKASSKVGRPLLQPSWKRGLPKCLAVMVLIPMDWTAPAPSTSWHVRVLKN